MRAWLLGIVFFGLLAVAGLLTFETFVSAATTVSPAPPRGVEGATKPLTRETGKPQAATRPVARAGEFDPKSLPADDAGRALALTRFVDGVLAESSENPWPKLEGAMAMLREVNGRLWMDPAGDFRSERVDPAPLSKVVAALAKRQPPVIVGCGLLTKMNRLKNADSVPGHRKLRVPGDSVSIVVRRQSYSLVLYLGEYALDAFPVGIGKPSTPTPSGAFEIREIQHLDKLARKDTAWIRPEDGEILYFGDAEYPFGKRFLRFAAPFEHYGIHGTDTEDAVGHAVSHGCVRMRNADVEQVASLVDPSGPCRVPVRIE